MTELLPSAARFVAQPAGGLAVYDVAHLLPKGRHRRATRRPGKGAITAAFLHHSGALGRPGFAGALGAVDFVTRKRKFPGAPYHLWLPFEPVRDPKGRLVTLLLAPWSFRAWHTGARANDIGVGLSLQGNTSKRPLSPSQIEQLEGVLPWVAGVHELDLSRDLGWHAIGARWGGRNKRACPGTHGEAWVRDYVSRVPVLLAA